MQKNIAQTRVHKRRSIATYDKFRENNCAVRIRVALQLKVVNYATKQLKN